MQRNIDNVCKACGLFFVYKHELAYIDTWTDTLLFRYARFNNLKVKNTQLKTLLAVGGWNAGSERFSRLCASSSLRKNFATTSVQFLRDYSFDGLDMDWEYPALRGGQKEDKDNFILLLKVRLL